MKLVTFAILTTTLTLTSVALAQPGPGGSGGRWGKDFTPGWSLMTPEERQEHRDKLFSLKSYEECKAYIDQHHEKMVARAKEQGRTVPAQPRRDPCAGLKVSQKS